MVPELEANGKRRQASGFFRSTELARGGAPHVESGHGRRYIQDHLVQGHLVAAAAAAAGPLWCAVMSKPISELNDRSREILRRVVETFVETGEPIGSRTLARRLDMTLSPATIRNAMADLQDAGLLYAPHTSAGRVPTEAGLRLFVDGLLEVGRLSESERQSIEAQCSASGKAPQQLLAEATKVLSGLSNCAGLVFAPKSETQLKHIEFVNLSPGRALVYS